MVIDCVRCKLAVRTTAVVEYVFSAQTKDGPGARDLSRRNAGTADPLWRISRPLRYRTFLRTEVRAPFALVATTLNKYPASRQTAQAGRLCYPKTIFHTRAESVKR